ncbi:hypothetical protein D3C76_1543150 [compost metagenome]
MEVVFQNAKASGLSCNEANWFCRGSMMMGASGAVGITLSRAAVLVTPPRLALMSATPSLRPLASPRLPEALLMSATAGASEDQRMASSSVTSWLLPSERLAMA